MLKKHNQAKFKLFQSHTGLCIWSLILATFGILCLSFYCDAVYIGYRALIFKIIGMIISLFVIFFFCWSLINLRNKNNSSVLSKSHPRLYRCGRVLYVLLIVVSFLFLSFRIVYPVMADLIHGPQTAIVSYIGTDSEKRKVGRHSGSYTLYHLKFQDNKGHQITINLTNREYNIYHKYLESLQHQELTFYPHTHIAIIKDTP